MEQFSPVSQVLHSDMGPSDSRETNLEAFPGKQGLSKSCWLPLASPQQVIDLLETRHPHLGGGGKFGAEGKAKSDNS